VLSRRAAKLIVVVSVDQLCQDYLIRFHDNFSAEGIFAGSIAKERRTRSATIATRFTVTGPGHAVQLHRTYPNQHGIIGNNWFDRASGKDTYCCDDPTVQLIGLPAAKGVSPRKLLVETVGDCELTSNNRSKVFGVAIKDRWPWLMTAQRRRGFLAGRQRVDDLDLLSQRLAGYLRVLQSAAMHRAVPRAVVGLCCWRKRSITTSGPEQEHLGKSPKASPAIPAPLPDRTS